MHPASLRCSSLAYDEYASLLTPCDAGASALAHACSDVAVEQSRSLMADRPDHNVSSVTVSIDLLLLPRPI